MRKYLFIIIFAGCYLSATNTYAQFKTPLKAAKNLANLPRVVLNKVPQQAYTIQSWVPAHFVATQHIELLPLQKPQHLTPVTASLLAKAGPSADQARMYDLGTQFIFGAYGEPGFGKAFYDNQTQLAQDLNLFYKAEAEVRTGPDGHAVKLYALPVDGILYKPAGYKEPIVLNSNKYFVIYDLQTKTGKIAENKPEIYTLFAPTQTLKKQDNTANTPGMAGPANIIKLPKGPKERK